jgi:hypothetical protein
MIVVKVHSHSRKFPAERKICKCDWPTQIFRQKKKILKKKFLIKKKKFQNFEKNF